MKTFFWPEHVRANDCGCQQIAPPESSEKTKYLLDLHERSKQRADRWPNTLDVRGLWYAFYLDGFVSAAWTHEEGTKPLQAQRQRKDKARRERLAASEAVKQQVRLIMAPW